MRSSVWVVDGACKAIEMGYCLVEVNEYSVTRFDKGGLSAEEVNIFLKLKTNHLVTHREFIVKTTKKYTLRTTGAQRELL